MWRSGTFTDASDHYPVCHRSDRQSRYKRSMTRLPALSRHDLLIYTVFMPYFVP
jgi:hypothetical protein